MPGRRSAGGRRRSSATRPLRGTAAVTLVAGTAVPSRASALAVPSPTPRVGVAPEGVPGRREHRGRDDDPLAERRDHRRLAAALVLGGCGADAAARVRHPADGRAEGDHRVAHGRAREQLRHPQRPGDAGRRDEQAGLRAVLCDQADAGSLGAAEQNRDVGLGRAPRRTGTAPPAGRPRGRRGCRRRRRSRRTASRRARRRPTRRAPCRRRRQNHGVLRTGAVAARGLDALQRADAPRDDVDRAAAAAGRAVDDAGTGGTGPSAEGGDALGERERAVRRAQRDAARGPPT